MVSETTIQEIDKKALNALIERIEHAIEYDLALSIDDMKLLLISINTLCTLQEKMENHDITLHKLRKLIGIVKQSESRRSHQKTDDNDSSNNNNNNNNNKKKTKNKIKQNNVNNPPPPTVFHPITDYQRGQCCPECDRGKLAKYKSGNLLRITGHASYEAVRHFSEQLRCNACQKIYSASLPDEVLKDGNANQMYGYTARAMMCIYKFYSGLPYYHQGNLSNLFGQTITASTIYDQCEFVANDIMPIFYEMKKQAANAHQFLIDDTYNRILTQKPELREKRNGKGKELRTGIYSSGMIAMCDNGHDIVLFETSLGHAGEHLDEILKKRDIDLEPPKVMCDALSSNTPTTTEVVQSYCNAHCRRNFYDLENKYPDKIGWVLDTYGVIWENEDKIKEAKLNDIERLKYHQEHSLPAMEQIKEWALEQTSSAELEEHGALCKAIKYLLRHYDKLIRFCVVVGALIDNNRMEEKLKIVIRGRKTAHFYKTPIGAGIANVLLTIIATSDSANINAYDYLVALQQNKDAVKLNPDLWLPWNYLEQLEKINEQKLKPDKQAA